MDLKIPKFDDLKDRLGFKDAPRPRHGSSSVRDNSYDDFETEDFGEYAFDDSADYAKETSQSAAKTASFAPQMPKLVTADDVRAHTQYTPNEHAEEAPQEHRDFAAPKADEQRSPGLNGLFDPTPAPSDTGAIRRNAPAASAEGSAAQTGAFAAHELSSVPSMPAVASKPRVVARATRILTVIKPESYADAERIAKILKSGDVAVLSLRTTPEELGKRILDFSFGVACALDARVECVSGHVFAITRGAGLTEGETSRLRDQGLM